jgi:hypothetical protein
MKRAGIAAGSHKFETVAYDPERDVMELTTSGRWGIADGLTPEGDLWFTAGEGSAEITGLRVRGARRREHEAGTIMVTLPEGTRAELRGARRALTAWQVPARGGLSRRRLRSPRS